MNLGEARCLPTSRSWPPTASERSAEGSWTWGASQGPVSSNTRLPPWATPSKSRCEAPA